MITKGVASVRSPVCNLQQFRPTLTHDAFADAVVCEFRKEYGIDGPVRTISYLTARVPTLTVNSQ
jgi:lipoate-protein ligase A